MRLRAAGALAAMLAAAPAAATDTSCVAGDGDWIERACFTDPLDPPRYGHGVLGNTPEWGALTIVPGPLGRRLPAMRDRLAPGGTLRLDTLTDRIIEDVAPRIVEITGGGPPEVLFVESDRRRGARIAIFDIERMAVVAGPFIGQRHRWLAPVGAADLNGDGRIEIAWVDRPHLVRELALGRVENGRIVEVARLPGLTNHRIGDEVIRGGLRDCGAGPEMILADAGFTQVMSARLQGDRIVASPLGLPATPAGFARALSCTG
jgi:hypothetical protein